MGAGPQLVGHRCPVLGGFLALGRQIADVLRGLQVGGVGAGALHCVHQSLRVVQQRAGPQEIAVPGLTLLVGGKQRGLEGLQQGVGADVGVGIVDEGARLVIAVGVERKK